MKILLSLILIGFTYNLEAQQNTRTEINVRDNYANFFKTSQAKYLVDIQTANKVLQNENKLINELISLNDSLLHEGNITDSVSEVYKEIVNIYKSKNDSLSNILENYNKSIASLPSFKKNFRTIIVSVPAFKNVLTFSQVKNELDYYNIKKALLASNLGAEKKQLKAILGNATVVQKVEAKKIDGIGDIKNSMLYKGSIDSNTASTVDKRVSTYLQRMEENAKEIKLLETSINTPTDYSANRTFIKARVLVIDSVVNKSASSRQYTFNMIEEGLQKNNKTLFSLGAFFGPGRYIIPKDKFENAQLYFSPVIDSLIKFSNKYNEVFRTATVLVYGYADASQISLTSNLYKEIVEFTKIQNPTREELNAGLSALRAEELSSMFTKIIKDKSDKFIALSKITFENLEAGKGEELPENNIKNYKVNDERRRVVIVYWSVLPN